MSVLRRLLGVGLISLALLSQPASAETSESSDPPITIRYSGTADSFREALLSPNKRMFREDHIQWGLSWRGRLSQLERSPNQKLKVELLRGSIQNVDKVTPTHYESCATTAVRRPGSTVAFFGAFDANKGSIFFNLFAPTTQDKLVATSPHTWCDVPTVWGVTDSQVKRYLLPKFFFDLRHKGETRSFNLSTKPQGRDREHAVIRSSVTVGGDLCPKRTTQRAVAAAPGTTFGCYVSLGDSYSSGEGAESYGAGTATGGNTCHRSGNAYPEIVARTLGAAPFRTKPGEESEFAACSGAVIDDLYARNHDAPRKNANEPPQRDHLTVRGKARIKLVTLSFGGNDIGFSRVVTDCVVTGFFRQVRARIGPDNFISLLAVLPDDVRDLAADAIAAPCSFRQQPLINKDLNVIRAKLVRSYRQVADQAPRARVLVVGYPNFFPTTVLEEPCLGLITPADTLWASRQIDRFDALILGAVRAAGRSNVVYVPPATAWRDHTICDQDSWFVQPEWQRAVASFIGKIPPSTPFIGRSITALVGLVRELNEPSISTANFFHPNVAGHAVLAQDVLARSG